MWSSDEGGLAKTVSGMGYLGLSKVRIKKKQTETRVQWSGGIEGRGSYEVYNLW